MYINFIKLIKVTTRPFYFQVFTYAVYIFIIHSCLDLPNHIFSLTVRLLTGLPPLDDLPSHCPLCLDNMSSQPWHAFTCIKLRRLAVTTRHNAVMYLLCEFARSHGTLVRLEPKDDSSLVPDGEFILPSSVALVDASGTHPHAPSYRAAEVARSGSAIVTRENAKHAKYDDYAASCSADMVPFVLDTYGRLGSDATKFITSLSSDSSLSAPSAYSMLPHDFLSRLLVLWHRHNGLIFLQWSSRARLLALRAARAARGLG